MSWDDVKKQKAVDMYQEREPTPENSMEIVKEIAEELDESPNGVRMILSRAEVYVKKEGAPAAKKAPAAGGGTSTRVSKEDAHAALTSAIEASGGTVDTDIVSKLTGKAALYFAGILQKS